MYEISTGSYRTCDGISRRQFLKVGGIGSAGLGLADVLRAEAAHAGTSAAGPRAKSVILVFLGGGLSHIDTFDPKPDAPAEVRGKYGTLPTVFPGIRFTDMVPKMAQAIRHCTLVRSGFHGNDHHETATNWVLTGNKGSQFNDYPAIGSVVNYKLGPRGPIPPYVAVPRNPSFSWELGTAAFLGNTYESFRVGDPSAKDWKVPNLAPPPDLGTVRVQKRQSLLSIVDTLAKRAESSDAVKSMDSFYQRAAQIVLSEEARSAFNMGEEKDTLRDRYGRNTFGQSCLLARRLVERGVRFVTVNYGGWDHHSKIYEGCEKKLPELDQGLSAFIEDLQDRGMFKDTLFVAMGEFGRTPKINKDAGRDHWGLAASQVWAGAGVKAGQVLGATNERGEFVTELPIKPGDVAATLYDALGVDYRGDLQSPEGRPVAILRDGGQPVRELYG